MSAAHRGSREPPVLETEPQQSRARRQSRSLLPAPPWSSSTNNGIPSPRHQRGRPSRNSTSSMLCSRRLQPLNPGPFRPEFDAPWVGRPYVTTLTINRNGRARSQRIVVQQSRRTFHLTDDRKKRTVGVLGRAEIAQTCTGVQGQGFLVERL